MKEYLRALGVFVLTVCLFGAAVLAGEPMPYAPPAAERIALNAQPTVLAAEQKPRVTVILDAGHGGEDGGAVSCTGAAEKTLNLSIVRVLGDMLSACGVDVIYTRTGDDGLYDGAAAGHRKMADLKNRLAVHSAHPEALFLSVHMNTFADANCRGIQFFYSGNHDASAVLAESMRSAVMQHLQPDNRRTCRCAGRDIYLLDRAVGPAVLAECGFLSNPEEAALLMTQAYREQIAAVLCVGILNYIKESTLP